MIKTFLIKAVPIIRRAVFAAALICLACAACFVWLWASTEIDIRQIEHINSSAALYDSEGRLFHIRLSQDSEWQIPIPLNEMGKWLPKAAVGIEDGRFYSHCGIDITAIIRAAFQNAAAGKIVSGASTITSQLIRMAVSERQQPAADTSGKRNFARLPRSFATKAAEFTAAVKLERVMSKDMILENYLNRAPFGGNIRGVQAAALIYFGKTASQLSPGEACLLIGMLKGPSLYRPDTNPDAAKKRRDSMITLLKDKGIMSASEAARAMAEELPGKRFAPPFKAYHFAELTLSRQNAYDGRYRIDTSLNSAAQAKLEGILTQTVRDFPRMVTMAAGIADNRTAKIIAWVGNVRWHTGNAENGVSDAAWVDCGRAPRSPGSTLKPFAYLSAAEQGFIAPSMLIADTSFAFSGRAPRNFDLQYRGAVTVRSALSESLNAPAVRILRAAEPETVLRLMRRAGLHHLTQTAEYYGDSLILGGCEATLLEELEAYTALASLGVHRPLSTLSGDDNNQAEVNDRLASPEACWMICDILNHRGSLSLLTRGTLGEKWNAALKTGTSYGLRDAWAAAWTPDYTVVVWAGIPNGASWSGLIGASAAAPAAMRILRAVSPSSSWYERPDGIASRRVCSLSGQPPASACPSFRYDWAIDGVTKTLPCSLHRIKADGAALIWPAEMGTAPASQKDGMSVSIKRSAFMKITSPSKGMNYIMAPFDSERKIPMRAEGGSKRIWWYLDGKYIGTSLPDETFMHSGIADGEHTIGAVDADGKSCDMSVRITTPGMRKENIPMLE